VLKNCLRRSELFVLVLTISVNNLDVEETASTLSFGLNCMNMRVQPKASGYTEAELTERVIRELNEKSRSLTDAVGELRVLKQANADLVKEKEELQKQHKAYEMQLRSLQRSLDEKDKAVEELTQMHQ
jgi:FtsZ-binding cell division protein ZapB